MTQRLDNRNFFIAAAACAAPLLMEEAVWANNLAGLVYVVFIWPIGAVCFLVLLGLFVISLLNYRRRGEAGRAKPAAGVFLAASAAVAVVYPIVVVLLDSAYQAGAPAGVIALSVIPVEAVALAVFALNLSLVRAGKGAR
jgi:hypothetical protein